MASTYQKLYSYTVPLGAGVSSITFNSIPATHTDLVITVSARSTATSGDAILYRLNSDSNYNYSQVRLEGTGSVAFADSFTAQTSGGVYTNGLPDATYNASTFGLVSYYIPNYLSYNHKTISVDAVAEQNTTAAYMDINSNIWKNVNPINSVTFFSADGANFVPYSEVTIYGTFNTDVSSTPGTPTVSTLTDVGGGTISAAITPAGSAAASYTVTSSPGGITATGTSPVYVSGLSPATSYTFTAVATNPVGVSSASSASSSITPYNGFVALQTVTVGSGGASSVTFSSIPSTYTHLQIRAISRGTNAAANDASIMQFNGDTGSNYYTYHQIFGDGSSATANSGGTGSSIAYIFGSAGSALANSFAASILDILDYSNTNKNKTVRNLEGFDVNGSGGYIVFRSGLWINTAAISSITLTPQTSSFAQYSSFALYGVK